MKFYVILLFFIIFGTSSFVFSQKDWEEVSYQNWTKDQVKKILTYSSWVKTTDHQYNVANIAQGEETATILLRSALTVRQALLRKQLV